MTESSANDADLAFRQPSAFPVKTPSSVFLVIGFLSLFGCSKPKDTPISENAFSILLPGQWSRRSEEGGSRIVFSSSTGREQLTVSLMPSSERMTPELRLSTFNRVLELRQQAESDGLAPSAITMTAPTVSEQSGIHSGRYSGFESASHRHFSCLLFCSSSLVATFYYEAIGLPQSEAEGRAKAILNSAKLTE